MLNWLVLNLSVVCAVTISTSLDPVYVLLLFFYNLLYFEVLSCWLSLFKFSSFESAVYVLVPTIHIITVCDTRHKWTYHFCLCHFSLVLNVVWKSEFFAYFFQFFNSDLCLFVNVAIIKLLFVMLLFVSFCFHLEYLSKHHYFKVNRFKVFLIPEFKKTLHSLDLLFNFQLLFRMDIVN